jgi:photosystem I subunit 11
LKILAMSVSKTDKSFDVVAPFQGDPFVGHLSTPVTSSNLTKTYLSLLPAYKSGLSPLLRGINIGFVHGYFLLGPFVKLGPLRNSDVALYAGFLSTIGLILILTLALTIYGSATFKSEKETKVDSENNLQTKKAWEQFKGGFFVGACGSAGFALICLSSVPTSIL